MERAGRILAKFAITQDAEASDQMLRKAWPAAVGKKIATHTGNVRLVRQTLVVEVEDAVWQRQLHTLRGQILDRLWGIIGRDTVTDLEFRIQTPRMRPQSEEQFTLSADEAERIADPSLRRVYRMARKRANA